MKKHSYRKTAQDVAVLITAAVFTMAWCVELLLGADAWISNHASDKVWDEITHPFANLGVQPLKCRMGK